MKRLLLIYLTLIISIPAHSFELTSIFLKDKEPFGNKHREQFLEILNEDPYNSQILEDIISKYSNINTHDDIFSNFYNCDTDVAGNFSPKVGLKVLYYNDTYTPQILNILDKAFLSKTIEMNSVKMIYTFDSFKICIKPNDKLGDSYAVIIHELTHFLGYELLADYNVFQAQGLDDFIENQLYIPGGEWQAHSVAAKSFKWIRTNFNYMPRHYYPLYRYYNEVGDVKDPQGLANYILNKRGYKKRFSARFKKNIASTFNLHSIMAGNLVSQYNTFNKNVKINKNNIIIMTNNVQIFKDAIENQKEYIEYLDSYSESTSELVEKRTKCLSEIATYRANILGYSGKIKSYNKKIDKDLNYITEIQKDILEFKESISILEEKYPKITSNL